jgi:hypothetical protein
MSQGEPLPFILMAHSTEAQFNKLRAKYEKLESLVENQARAIEALQLKVYESSPKNLGVGGPRKRGKLNSYSG